jgi:hypothetical protein
MAAADMLSLPLEKDDMLTTHFTSTLHPSESAHGQIAYPLS